MAQGLFADSLRRVKDPNGQATDTPSPMQRPADSAVPSWSVLNDPWVRLSAAHGPSPPFWATRSFLCVWALAAIILMSDL